MLFHFRYYILTLHCRRKALSSFTPHSSHTAILRRHMAHRRPNKGRLRRSLARTIMCECRDCDYFSFPGQLLAFPSFNSCVDFSSVLLLQVCIPMLTCFEGGARHVAVVTSVHCLGSNFSFATYWLCNFRLII